MIAKILYRLILPGGLPLITAVALLQLGPLDDYASTIRFVPAAVAVTGLILCVVFRRSRLFFALLALAAAQAALTWVTPRVSERAGHVLLNAIALLVPLTLAGFALVPERGIVSAAGRRRMVVVALEIMTVGVLCLPQLTQIAVWLERPFFPERFSAWSRLAQPELVAFAVAGVVMIGLLAKRYHPAESSLLWASLAWFIALRMGATTYQAAIFWASGGVAIMVALLETSYKLAYHDELTQLPSRRSLNEDLMKLPDFYTISMVDVDHFKKFNDTYGHDSGDQALRMVASRLARVTGGGKAYRYGGEEFAIVFPGKTSEDVLVYLEGLRRLIEQSAFMVRGKERRSGAKGRSRSSKNGKKEANVTVSIGVASCNGDRMAPADVMRVADQALYRAKSKGRNCTVIAHAKKGAGSAQPSMRVVSAS
jgi:diguanylate cyclase (GGDEF)-like protein